MASPSSSRTQGSSVSGKRRGRARAVNGCRRHACRQALRGCRALPHREIVDDEGDTPVFSSWERAWAPLDRQRLNSAQQHHLINPLCIALRILATCSSSLDIAVANPAVHNMTQPEQYWRGTNYLRGWTEGQRARCTVALACMLVSSKDPFRLVKFHLKCRA